jgi:hypothetical protein
MSIAEEIEKLDQLRKSGALTDEEFQLAKSRVLGGEHPPSSPPSPEVDWRELQNASLGSAANRYVSFQMVMSVIGLIIFLIFVGTIVSKTSDSHSPRGWRNNPAHPAWPPQK